MTANTPTDRKLKNGLLDDTLTIINIEKMYVILYVDLQGKKNKLEGSTLYIGTVKGSRTDSEI